MLDLRDDLSGLWQAAARIAVPGGGGRVVMFMAAREGEGTSSVATSFALMAAARAGRTAWLIDLDFERNDLYTALSKGRIAGLARPGRPLDASLGTEQIYSVPGAQADPAMRKLLTAHQIEDTRLLVTRFRTERLAPGRSPVHVPAPGWWAALRRISDWAVLDAPALTRAPSGLTYAGATDGVFLVVQADRTGADEVAGLRGAIEGQGGTVLGVVMNRLKG